MHSAGLAQTLGRQAMAAGPCGRSSWRPLVWAGTTVSAALTAAIAIFPRPCITVDDCSRMHEVAWNALSRYVVCSLLTALVLEIAALRLTWKSARPLVGMVRGIEHTFVPPLLLCVSFFVLILENMFIGALWLVHAAAPGVGNVSGRPVYSAIYAEWLINVPILLVLAGTCALGRPLSDVSRPLVVTNLYIILAWSAYFMEPVVARWSAILLAFLMYGWASVDMAQWVLKFREATRRDVPARNLRCALSVGLIVIFFVYGLVYLAAHLGMISSHMELSSYIIMNVGVKLVILLAFVGIRSSQFYDLLVCLLVNKCTPFERQIAVANDFGDVEHASSLPLLQ